MKYAREGVPFGGIESDGSVKYWLDGKPYPFLKLTSTYPTVTKNLAYKVLSSSTIQKSLNYKVLRPAIITVRIYPSVDGTVEHWQDDLTFTALRGAAGNGANSTATTDNTVINASATYTDKFIKLERAVFCFDTSVIGSGSEIISATLSIHNGTVGQNSLGGTPSMCITGGTLASHTTLSSGDYDAFTDNEYATRKLVSSYAYNTRYNYDLNAAGLAYISKTDHTVFFFRNSWDVDNSFGGTWANSAYCQINSVMTEYGDSTRPYLDVTFRISPLDLTKSLAYKVSTFPSAIQKTLNYEVLSSPTIQKSLVYRVLSSPTALTKGLVYRVLTIPSTIQKSLVYRVLTIPTALTKGLAYKIKYSPSTITKDLTYAVPSGASTYTTIQKSLVYYVYSPAVYYLKSATSDLYDDEAPFGKKIEKTTETEGNLGYSVVNDGTETGYGYTEANDPNISHWPTGGFTVKVDVHSGNSYIYLSLFASRLNSSGVVQESTTTTDEQQITTAQVYTFNIASKDWSSGNASDRLRIGYNFRNSHPTSNQAFTIHTGTANTAITTVIGAQTKGVQVIQKSLVYRVKYSPSTIQKSLAYKIKYSPSSITKSLVYRVLSIPSTIQKSLAYAVIRPSEWYTIQKGLVYRVLSIPSTIQKGLIYRVLSIPSSLTKGMVYRVLTIPSSITKSLVYRVLSVPSTVQKDLAYKVKSAPTVTKNLAYKVLSIPSTITKGLTYRLLNYPSSITKDLDYSVSRSSTVQKTLVYRVLSSSTIQKGMEYTVPGISYETIQKGLVYRVISVPSSITKGLVYRVSSSPSAITKGLVYRVISSPSPVTKPMVYRLLNYPSAITKTLDYEVSFSPSTIQKTLVYRVQSSSTVQKTLAYEPTPLSAPIIDASEVDYDIEIGWS